MKQVKDETKSVQGKSRSRKTRSTGGIRMKLIAAFLVPVVCIIALGFISYQKASNALIQNYEASIVETLDMTGQYYIYSFRSILSDLDEYYQDIDLRDYYADRMSISPTKEIQLYNSQLNTMKRKVWSDDLLENIYVLSDTKDSLTTNGIEKKGMYSSFLKSKAGQGVATDAGHYFIFGSDPTSDELFGSDSSAYAIRIARKYKDSKTCIVADINRDAFMETIKRLNTGNDCVLAIITSDGRELSAAYREQEASVGKEQTGMVFSDQSFYEAAVISEKAADYQYVTYQEATYLFAFTKLSNTGAMICMLVPKSEIIKQASEIKDVTIVIVIIACILAVLIGTLIAGYVSTTIRYIAKQLKKIAEGDLTVQIKTKQKDEFQMLAQDITDMVTNMNELVHKIKLVGTEVYAAANQVTLSSKTFVDSASDIKLSVSDIEAGITQLDQNSADCLIQMDSLSQKIALVNHNTSEIGSVTNSAVRTIEEGINAMNALTDKTKSTTQNTAKVIDMITDLEVKSKSIVQILNVINDIARQTKLLSLNASIESARAGTNGQGFAVVAMEIRKLAEQSMNSANQIGTIIKEIAICTSETVMAARDAEVAVKDQEEAVTDTTSSFLQLQQQILSLTKELDSILVNVENMEQSRASTLEAVESISAVSEETTACSITVSESAQNQVKTIVQLDLAASQLLEHAGELDGAINRFKIE